MKVYGLYTTCFDEYQERRLYCLYATPFLAEKAAKKLEENGFCESIEDETDIEEMVVVQEEQ